MAPFRAKSKGPGAGGIPRPIKMCCSRIYWAYRGYVPPVVTGVGTLPAGETYLCELPSNGTSPAYNRSPCTRMNKRNIEVTRDVATIPRKP